MSSSWLSPLVSNSPHISPSTLLDKVKECRKVTRFTIKVASQKSGTIWSEKKVIVACFDELTCPGCSPWGFMAACVSIDNVEECQAP